MNVKDKYTYRVIWSEADGEYVGLCTEFPSLSWLAESQDAAFSGIRKVVEDVLREMKKNKEAIPEAVTSREHSGKLMLRIPPQLHQRLALEAQEENVSLNRLISAKLAEGNANKAGPEFLQVLETLQKKIDQLEKKLDQGKTPTVVVMKVSSGQTKTRDETVPFGQGASPRVVRIGGGADYGGVNNEH